MKTTEPIPEELRGRFQELYEILFEYQRVAHPDVSRARAEGAAEMTGLYVWAHRDTVTEYEILTYFEKMLKEEPS